MVALLVLMAVMAVALTAALPAWSTLARREREAELVFRGEQYARAIALFQRKYAGAFPPNHRRPRERALPPQEVQGSNHRRRLSDDRCRPGRPGAAGDESLRARPAGERPRAGGHRTSCGDAAEWRWRQPDANGPPRRRPGDRRGDHRPNAGRPGAERSGRGRVGSQRRNHGCHQQERPGLASDLQGCRPLQPVAVHRHPGVNAGRWSRGADAWSGRERRSAAWDAGGARGTRWPADATGLAVRPRNTVWRTRATAAGWSGPRRARSWSLESRGNAKC